MCEFCFSGEDDLTGCAEYGHDFEPCDDCDDPDCDIRVCIYCGEQY